jgi:SAM-dependent MidA family methyltransferase
VPLREAWQQALYGPDGFYRGSRPGDHFRTSSHVGPVFAEMVLRLARSTGSDAVVDYGAGAGELLSQLHRLDPELRLTGVEVRPRPATLAPEVAWVAEMPEPTPSTLVVANELLDNVPCDVVELDPTGRVRLVEVDTADGTERLGGEPAPAANAWLERWWPLRQPGQRAEVGLERDELWAAVCRGPGRHLMVDYVHCRESRPAGGTLASYRRGRQLPVGFGGDRDVTAHVAVDSLRARVGGTCRTQSAWCDLLRPPDVRRPAPALAHEDPPGYVRALARSGELAELRASPGLGDFCWLLTGPDLDPALVGA